MADYSDLIRPNIRNAKRYQPGKAAAEIKSALDLEYEVCRMNNNENMHGPSPMAIEAIKQAASQIHLYPDDSCYELRCALAERHNVIPEMVFVTSGGVEFLYNLGFALLGPGDDVVMARPTFMLYPVLSQLTGAHSIEVTGKNQEHDLLAMADAVTDKTKLIWVANPSNPSGTYNNADEVDRFVKAVDDRCLIVFDEAYFDFVDAPDYPETTQYLREGRRVCITHTLSKTHGLAGVRLGYCIGDPELLKYLWSIKPNFSVNSLALAGALAALKDEEHLREGYGLVKQSKEFFYRELDRLELDYLHTQTNFIFVDFGTDTKKIAEALGKRGFLVRSGHVFNRPNHIRISFGTMPMNKRFIETLKDVLEEAALDTVAADALEIPLISGEKYQQDNPPLLK